MSKQEIFENILKKYINLLSETNQGYCVGKSENDKCPSHENCSKHHVEYMNNIYNEYAKQYSEADDTQTNSITLNKHEIESVLNIRTDETYCKITDDYVITVTKRHV